MRGLAGRTADRWLERSPKPATDALSEGLQLPPRAAERAPRRAQRRGEPPGLAALVDIDLRLQRHNLRIVPRKISSELRFTFTGTVVLALELGLQTMNFAFDFLRGGMCFGDRAHGDELRVCGRQFVESIGQLCVDRDELGVCRRRPLVRPGHLRTSRDELTAQRHHLLAGVFNLGLQGTKASDRSRQLGNPVCLSVECGAQGVSVRTVELNDLPQPLADFNGAVTLNLRVVHGEL